MTKNLFFFFKVGLISFGKMVATNYMFEEFVEKRKKLTKDEFFAINGFCKLLPGPSQTQMSIILGIMEGGWLLGIATGLMYLLPSFLLLTFAAFLYFDMGVAFAIDKLNYGLVPFSLALLIEASFKLGKKSINSLFTFTVFILSGILSFFKIDMFLIVLGAGLLGLLVHIDYKKIYYKITKNNRLNSISIPLFFSEPLVKLFLFFLKLGSIVYGGGLVLIPMIHDEIVYQSQFLTEDEFLLGFALGSSTPGPVILTVAFIAYKMALSLGFNGILGSVIAGFGVMLPSFVLILSISKVILNSRSIPLLSNIAVGIMAATLGTVVLTSIELAQTSLTSSLQWILAIAFFILIYFIKINPLILLLLGGSIGFFL